MNIDYKKKYLKYKQKYLETKQKGGCFGWFCPPTIEENNKTIEEDIFNPIYIPLETISTHTEKVFSLSDIHGDFHALIISLRDCAKVIGKTLYNPEIVDETIERNLLIDICESDGLYNETLGYEWIGGNSYVIICGDIIDPKRPEGVECSRKTGDTIVPCLDYPQLEIKLLRFINAINKKALKYGGRIIKLLGNHEIENIKQDNTRFINDYAFPKINYYRGFSRYNIFNVGNPGFNLLFEYECKLLIIINNTIYVHGEIPIDDVLKINTDNFIINDKYNPSYKQNWKIIQNNYNSLFTRSRESPLWLRNWGDVDNYDSRLKDGSQEAFCSNEIKTRLNNFIGDYFDIENMRVVLGHCVQSNATLRDIPHSTFSYLLDSTNATKTYSIDKIYNGVADTTDQNKIFGITMQCPKYNEEGRIKDFFIYHIDIGSSRGFDLSYEYITNNSDENKYLFSKTPQILCIDNILGNDIITIIKSKMKNTRIHLPRDNYEEYISRFPTLDINDRTIYDKKYIKVI